MDIADAGPWCTSATPSFLYKSLLSWLVFGNIYPLLISYNTLMGNPELKWHNVINRAFSPRPSRTEASISLPTTPRKSMRNRLQRSKSFLVRSLRKFKAGTSSMDTMSDDDLSFWSPMPRELRSPSPDGSDFSVLEQWDTLNEGDPFRRSLMEVGGVLDISLSPSIPLRSHTLPTRPRVLSSVSSSPSLSKNRSRESILSSDSHKWGTLNRSPTPLPYSIRHGPVQYSTTSISSNFVSQTHRLIPCNSVRNSPNPDRDSLFSSSTSFVSCQSSPLPSLARSRSCSPLLGPQTPRPKNPLSRRLSASISLQNLRSDSTNQSYLKPLPPFPPSSFIDHQPGLEYRVIRGLAHSRGGSHVPIGATEF